MVAGTLETVKLVSDVASNAVTILGVAIGGWWTYRTFIRERTRWPKASLELAMTHRELTPDQTLLHVKVKVHNAGRGLMTLTKLRVDVRQVLPLTDGSAQALRDGSLFENRTWMADWPWREEDEYVRQWGPRPEEPSEPKLEPGENDEFGNDFIVPSTLETVYVYAHLENEARRGRDGLGWTVTSYYDLAGAEGGKSTRNLIRSEAV